jgi:CRISPR-associated protein Cas2
MPMTVVVTRNAQPRVRGFLASCMCEIAPGVYTAPRMTKGVRQRVWAVLNDWFIPADDSAIVITWPDLALPGGQGVATLGLPAKELCDHNGVFLVRRRLLDEAPTGGSLTGKP